VPQVLPLAADEKISSVIPVTDFKEDEFVILLTKVSLYSDYTYTYVSDCVSVYSYAHAAASMLHELFIVIIGSTSYASHVQHVHTQYWCSI
jgi:hypothetical protein